MPAGHRLRVSVSSAYWPWAWPSPEPVTLTIQDGRLRLPVRPRRDEPEPAPFDPPEWAEPLAVETIQPAPTSRELRHDPETGAHETVFEWDVGGRRRLAEARTEMDDTSVTSYRIVDGDPLSASGRVPLQLDARTRFLAARVDTQSTMTCTATEFIVEQRLDAYEGDEQVYSAHVGAVVPARRRLT